MMKIKKITSYNSTKKYEESSNTPETILVPELTWYSNLFPTEEALEWD